MILNPGENKYEYLDEKSRAIMLKTIEFFENQQHGCANGNLPENDQKAGFKDPERFDRIWGKYVEPLNNAYEMNP